MALRLRSTILGFFLVVCVLNHAPVRAGEIYVDSLLGDDAFDGRTETLTNELTGPVRTFRRGLERVRSGDRLILVPRGVVFTGELSLIGPRCSGLYGTPFIIEGNNVVLDGSRPVPVESWEELKSGVWKFTPWRKGTFLLLRNGHPVAEHRCSPAAARLPAIPTGSWCAWQGSIYYQAKSEYQQSPRDLNFSYAADGVGLTLLDVQDVIIRNLKVRHYRLDAVNAHDRCRNVILENVQLEENGRAGLAAGGNSLVGMRNCQVTGNRIAQILVSERAQVELLKTTLGDAPGIPFRITGGHLLIDEQEVRMHGIAK